MKLLSRLLAAVLLTVTWAGTASPQTADEVADRCLAALGGRAAFEKLTSRSASGTITLSTPGGDVSGTVELLNQVPNKSRTLIKVDLSALGAGQLVVDQRFDGTAGYVMDSLQGNRDITGNQLDNLKNGSFPHPLLTYKQSGASVTLSGKETVDGREAYVLTVDPPTGSSSRQYIDAETYLPIKTVATMDAPQVGKFEQTTEFHDYRVVDGIKLPHQVTATSSIQTITIALTHVEHNVRVYEALFSKPKP